MNIHEVQEAIRGDKDFKKWKEEFEKCQKSFDPAGGECCALCGMSPDILSTVVNKAILTALRAARVATELPDIEDINIPSSCEPFAEYKAYNVAVEEQNKNWDQFMNNS